MTRNPPVGWDILSLLAWVFGCILFATYKGGISASLAQVWLSNVLPYFLLALAAGVVISCGQIDISTGGVLSLAGMLIVAFFPLFGGGVGGVVAAHVLAVSVVMAIYLFYAAVASRGISTLLATLSVLLVAKGFATLIQSCVQGVGEVCRSGQFMARGTAILPGWATQEWSGSVSACVAAYAIILAASIYWRYRSRWGLEHIAVGMDVSSASFCRIPVSSIYSHAFILSGALVVLATLSRLHGSARGGWSANTGWGDELTAIAIAVIGGTRVTGGKINPIGILLAAFGVYLSRDIIISDLGVPAEVASLLFGMLLLIVVWFSGVGRPMGRRGG